MESAVAVCITSIYGVYSHLFAGDKVLADYGLLDADRREAQEELGCEFE